MLNPTFQKGLLALSVASLLCLGATAQSGNPDVKRDPFINNQGPAPLAQPRERPTPRPITPSTPSTPSVSKITPAPNANEKVVVVVPAPEVTVSGIVASAGKRQAILWTGTRSIVVSEGQQLADYRVKSIDSNSVTFSAQGKNFRVPLGAGT